MRMADTIRVGLARLTKAALIDEVKRLRADIAAGRKRRLDMVERFAREKHRHQERAEYHERGMRKLQRVLLEREDYRQAEQMVAAERARADYWQRRTRILALALAQAGLPVPPPLGMDDVAMANLSEALAVQHATH